MCKLEDSDELDIFPKDVFPEDAFPEEVFPSDVFPRPKEQEEEDH